METKNINWGIFMIVFLLEEKSMEALLNEILPQILGNEPFLLIPHEGKGDLLQSIPRKLKGWPREDTSFVIVHDQDANDCMQLKEKILDICKPYNRKVLVRIVCRELESWYFGDLDAVEAAYGKSLKSLRNRSKYRIPDIIIDPKSAIKKVLPELTQIDGARRIGKHMLIDKNSSHSFHVFVDGVRSICMERETT